MIFFNRHLATFQAFSVQVGKAFIHPETVQTNTSKYQGLFLAYRLHLSHTVLLVLESLGPNNAGPTWSKELFVLSEFLHGTV
jgi:hypothetical protein